MHETLQYRNGDPSVMVDCGGPHKDISNSRVLGFEASSCAHTDDQVRLESLAGQEGAQGCWDCTNIVHTVLSVLACIHRHLI